MKATLREVCMKYGVSRRAVQGYEKEGLVSATGKNKMGHLLYDDQAQERIHKIRVFQNLGFSIKEIKEIIDLPKKDVIPILNAQIVKLQKERSRIEEEIRIALELIAREEE